MRLIDADAFSRTIGILADKMDRSGQIVCEQLQAILGCYEEDAPTVDIVRCKDCTHYNISTHGCKRNSCIMPWEENDFCSYGEREGE